MTDKTAVFADTPEIPKGIDSNDPALFVKLIDQQLERLAFMAKYLADDEIRESDLLKPLDLLETDRIIATAEQVKISMEIINKQFGNLGRLFYSRLKEGETDA